MGLREAWRGLFTPAAAPEEERASYHAPSVPAWISSASLPIVTTSTAAQSVAIRSTVDLIASITSELPIDVYSGRGGKRKEVTTPGNLEDPGGDSTGREDWGYRLLQSWLLAGNIYGDVIDWLGDSLATCDLINPDQVTASVVDGKVVWRVSGREVTNVRNFKHWRVNPVAGRVLGLSPIEHHAAIIGVSLAATRFGRQWFTDGAHPGGMLAHDGDLDPEQAAIAKARFLAAQGGSEPIVLGGKWTWSDIQISPEESQFLETQGMSEAQCARIFGPGFAEILGYETGQKMTYSNVVERRQDLLVLGLSRWFRRYERILSLFTPPGQWVEVNRDALLETTTMQRYAAHKSALDAGWRTINEIREIENLDPVDWGNEPKPVTQQPTKEEDPENGNTPGA